MLGKLNETQIDNLLTSQASGSLACCSDDTPYIVPTTYIYNGKYIYGQTNEGMKLDIMRKNPKVCFLVNIMSNMANWQSVILYGTFEELKGNKAKEAKVELQSRLFPLLTSSTIHPHQHEVESNTGDNNYLKPVMYRIKIKSKTGRFEKS